MLIAQISDTHTKAPDTRLFGHVDAFGHFEKLVARIEALDPAPDLVIHTGDIANDGEPSDYAAALDCLGRLTAPVAAGLGNHDRREAARAALGHFPGVPASGRFAYVLEDFPVRLVMLDSLVEGAPHGQLGPEQLAWLDATLAAGAGRPTVVALHHPPFATGVRHMDAIGLRDADALAGVLRRHPQVARLIAGHVHRAFTTVFAGTLAMTAPGAAHQVVYDAAEDAPARWSAEPPGLLLHRWMGEAFVTSALAVDDPPHHPFSDAHTKAG